MVVKKGCFNGDCIIRIKKQKYQRFDDRFCQKCGSKLDYVCAGHGCYERLPNDKERFCEECLKKQEERKQKTKEVLKKSPVVVAEVAGGITTAAKAVPFAIKAVQKAGPTIIKAGKGVLKFVPR